MSVLLWGIVARGQPAYELEPVGYKTAAAEDAVARLQRQIDAGTVKLQRDAKHGFLAALLRELDIPASSQTLVFSKTSFQREGISPRTPRAIYFNDDVYVGWVRNGEMIEIAATDPKLGPIFYTLEQRGSQRR